MRVVRVKFTIGKLFFTISIALIFLMSSGFSIFERMEDFALLAENPKIKIVDKIVNVPPFNRTLEEAERIGKNWGWVGFNLSLPHEGLLGYEAYGVIISADPKIYADVVMGIVNETGLELLTFDGFSEEAWRVVKVYATASLDANKQYQKFWLNDLDRARKYCVLFRGRGEAANDFQILISVKEAWYEGKVLFPPTPVNAIGTIIVLLTGLGLLLLDRRAQRMAKFRMRKRRLTNSSGVNQTSSIIIKFISGMQPVPTIKIVFKP